MSEALRILLLGRDGDLFRRSAAAANDTRERHLHYFHQLQAARPGSELAAVVHTFRPHGERFEEPVPGMRIYGTHSINRAFCPFDEARIVRRLRADGWVPHVISCQTGYEEAIVALLAADRRSRIQVQMHGDFYGEAFARESPLRRLQRALVRAAVRRADHVRVVSQAIARPVAASGDIAAERIFVAPVPITFEPLGQGHGALATPRVLYVGRLAPEKDLALWCDVAEIVRDRVPAARFAVAGEGPERDMLCRRAAGLGEGFDLLGPVAYNELAEVYASASVFLLTSRHEGMGRVVVEAMLAGVPVVSTATAGPCELIENGVTGIIVPSREPRAIASEVVGLLLDADKARRIAAEARHRAAADFELDAAASKLVRSWEAAAALPRRAR